MMKVDQNTRREAIIEAVKAAATDLTAFSAWADLDALSTHTSVDSVEVLPEGIVLNTDETFQGVLNLYLTLQYGHDNNEGFSTSESMLAKFSGSFDEGEPRIDDIEVDTSRFYR